MTIGDETAEVLEPAGQFGFFASHDGPESDVFLHQLSGENLVARGRAYELRVPHNGEATIQAWVGAGRSGEITPPSPKPPTPPKRVPWWLRLWRALVRLVRRLFKK
jgi:hypothetical protein